MQQGVAHTSQVVIQGGSASGSAGGFTVLNALVTSSAFACGASHYVVADMLALASDTHDFESRYLDSQLGPMLQQQDRRAAWWTAVNQQHSEGFTARHCASRLCFNRQPSLCPPLPVLEGSALKPALRVVVTIF